MSSSVAPHVVIASRPAPWVAEVERGLRARNARVSLVDTGADLIEALATRPDLVVGSLDLVGPTPVHALAMVRTVGFAVPFVVVVPRGAHLARANVARLAAVVGLASLVEEGRALPAALGMLSGRAGPQAGPEPLSRHASSDGRGLIVLADDDAPMRQLLAEELGARGHRVVEVRDGDELVLLLHRSLEARSAVLALDLVISDVRMPGATGLQALAFARAARGLVPFILMTSFGDDETHAEGHRLGALAVFDKPLEVDELLDTVDGVVDER